jgi:hypothetical protein
MVEKGRLYVTEDDKVKIVKQNYEWVIKASGRCKRLRTNRWQVIGCGTECYSLPTLNEAKSFVRSFYNKIFLTNDKNCVII